MNVDRPRRARLEIVLLEFEGILVDTRTARQDAMLSVLREDGIVLSDSEYRDECLGRSTGEGVRSAASLRNKSLDEIALDLLEVRVEREFSRYMEKGAVLMEGARESLERMAARLRLGIVSRARRRNISEVLSLAGMEELFVCVIGADDVSQGKPAPTGYQLALRRMRALGTPAAPSQVVALEDGAPGIRAARAAGVRCVAVGDLPAHLAMEADALVASLQGMDVDRLERLLARHGGPDA